MSIHRIYQNLFWALDKIKGGKVKQHLTDLHQILNNQTTDETNEIIKVRLQNLLKHHTSTSKYYLKFSHVKDLEGLPVINKVIIKDNYQDFRSSKFKDKQLFRVSTSGSTGIPFKTFHDNGKRSRQVAETIFFNSMGGFELGDKTYYLRIWNEINKLNLFQKRYKNIVPLNTADLTAKSIYVILNKMKLDPAPKVLLGYGSSLEVIAKYIKDLGIISEGNYNLKSILAMAESISPQSKAILKDFFSCPLYSRYSNSENGFIGHQFLENSDDYIINTASYIIEILDLKYDKPVDEGEMGRIVITDLFNYAVPFIRYDTGDVGSCITREVDGKPYKVFNKIHGRMMDFITDVSGNLLSPHIVDYTLRNFSDVDQFQLIQKGPKEFHILINTKKPNVNQDKEIIKELIHILGRESVIKLQHVDDIPLFSSGKRKIVINEMGIQPIIQKQNV